ncbi:MAG: HD domain-containing protein [Candidatus Melainabacteria bacterium]|nr:HD domain-containing protein [Candidatus Melainabacteria bacterium]MBI3307768.1 HD domain-containing protein [Candidatus Melainabacteria bacterium]
MVSLVTPQSVVTKYLALQQAIASGKVNIDSLLKGETALDDVLQESPILNDGSASANVFNAQGESDCEINKCLDYISTKIPEDFLPDIIRLFSAIAAKDLFTAKHSARVCMYSTKIGESCNLNEEEKTALIIGSLLHDIGKLGFPDYLFQNVDELTNNEFLIIKNHPEMGEEILKGEPLSTIPKLLIPVRSHHESINGNGYPDGLKGLRIPLLAKIVKLADCLDAMTVQRTYNTIFPIDIALQKIHDARNKEFDSDLITILEIITEEMLRGEAYQETTKISQEQEQTH